MTSNTHRSKVPRQTAWLNLDGRLLRRGLGNFSLILLTGFGIGCAANSDQDPQATEKGRAAEHLALGALTAPTGAVGTRSLPAAPAQSRAVGMNHPGHFSDKVTEKPAHVSAPAGRAAAPVPNPAVIAKQAAYLQEWRRLQPSLAKLSPDEQSVRRANLKRSILGE